MEDTAIIDLYWQRNDNAIRETATKYGHYCQRIAYNILSDKRDTEEVVNDTYLHAWNSIPPHRPRALSAFLGKITRNLSLSCYRRLYAQRRGGGTVDVALDELDECVPSSANVEAAAEFAEISEAINAFLKQLQEVERNIFVSRYWFFASIGEICKSSGYSKSKVESMLHRTRLKLNTYLKKEGLI